ncbi:MAG: autotransporter outer membrane beta-barrel domain-containing protein [Alphaproteobacteria bacterium]|nr:autotransporter outer membrane beta-barrel domain-containing protein [Alphaproteobacteria bacterium]
MKNNLLLSTALIAVTFAGGARAEDFVVSKTAAFLPAGQYDKIDIDTGVVFFDSFLSDVGGNYAKAKEVYLHGDFWDADHEPIEGVVITYDPNKFEGEGKPSIEYPFQIGEATLEVEGTFKAENTRFDVASSTLIADKIITRNTDITTMTFGHEEANDFVLAGKNYAAPTGTVNSYILTNELTLNVDGNNPMGIGDDRINFIVKDGVTLNLKGKSGMTADAVVDNYEDFMKGEDTELKQYRLGKQYGNLTIEGGKINLSGQSIMLATNDITISGGEVNFSDEAQIVSLAFYDAADEDYTFKNQDSIFKDFGRLDGAYGNFRMTGGTVNINGNNQITGKDYVTIAGGTLNINVNATLSNVSLNGESFGNTGFMITDKGVMNIRGTLNSIANIEGSSPVAVANGGILRLSHNKALIKSAVGVLNKGTLEIGKNKPTITGPVIFYKGSTFGVTMDSHSAHGVLNADVIFKDGASVTISHDRTMKVGDKFKNVKFINGQVAAENKDLSNGRFRIILNNDGTFDVEYLKSARDRVAEVGGSETGIADAWDSLDVFDSNIMASIKGLLDELSQYNAVGYAEALRTLAPSAAPIVQQTQSETANQIFNAVGSQLNGGSHGHANGISSGDAFNDVSLWAQGLLNHAKLSKNGHSGGFSSDTWGTALGIEKKLNHAVKVGLGYAYSKTNIDATGRDTDVKTHSALLYGEYKPNDWYVNGILSYGWSDYEEDKNVAGNNVKAKYDAETFGMQVMTGYDLHTKYAIVTPETGLRYVHIKTDTYTDAAKQRIKSRNSDIVTAVIGSKVSHSMTLANGMRFKPEAKLAFTYDVAHDDVKSTVTLPNGSSYNVNGKALNRFGVEIGTGVTTDLSDNTQFFVGYEGKFRHHYQDHSGQINLKYNF